MSSWRWDATVLEANSNGAANGSDTQTKVLIYI